jgi:hypothetical protein
VWCWVVLGANEAPNRWAQLQRSYSDWTAATSTMLPARAALPLGGALQRSGTGDPWGGSWRASANAGCMSPAADLALPQRPGRLSAWILSGFQPRCPDFKRGVS